MSQKDFNQLLRLNAIVTGRTHLTEEELWAEIQESARKSARDAEVEEILAESVKYGSPIPGDVTDEEIAAAVERYKNDTIFRLIHVGGGGDLGPPHGKSFTDSLRPAVVAHANSGGTWTRDMNMFSRSAMLGKIIADVAQH